MALQRRLQAGAGPAWRWPRQPSSGRAVGQGHSAALRGRPSRGARSRKAKRDAAQTHRLRREGVLVDRLWGRTRARWRGPQAPRRVLRALAGGARDAADAAGGVLAPRARAPPRRRRACCRGRFAARRRCVADETSFPFHKRPPGRPGSSRGGDDDTESRRSTSDGVSIQIGR